MGNINYVKKKDDKKKDNIINYATIAVIAILVISFGIMVSKEKSDSALIENHIKEISYNEYKETIKKDEYTIVLLASPTCSHCQDYKPFVNQLAGEYNFEVKYVNVNSRDLTEEEYIELHDGISILKTQYDSKGNPAIPTPTTVVFKNGEEVASILGDKGYDALKEFLLKNGVI